MTKTLVILCTLMGCFWAKNFPCWPGNAIFPFKLIHHVRCVCGCSLFPLQVYSIGCVHLNYVFDCVCSWMRICCWTFRCLVRSARRSSNSPKTCLSSICNTLFQPKKWIEGERERELKWTVERFEWFRHVQWGCIWANFRNCNVQICIAQKYKIWWCCHVSDFKWNYT